MSDYTFVCNIQSCREKLPSRAWVTVCFHAFCIKHGEEIVIMGKCPVCNARIDKKLDMVQLSLNSLERKTGELIGINPDTILKILHQNLKFWSQQVSQEKLMKDEDLKSTKKQFKQLNDQVSIITMKYNMKIQKYEQEILALKTNRKDLESKIESLVQQLAEKSRILRSIQDGNDFMNQFTTNQASKENKDFVFSPIKKHVNVNFMFEKEEDKNDYNFWFDFKPTD